VLNQSGKQSYFHTFTAKCFNANLEDQLNLIYFARNLGSYYLPSVINQSFRHTSRYYQFDFSFESNLLVVS